MGVAALLLRGAPLKDGCAARCLDDQFGLKKPCLIAQPLWLLLPIDEEERHRPDVIGAAHDALDEDVWLLLGLGLPGRDRSFFQWEYLWFALSLLAPPYPPGSTLRRLDDLALSAFIVPPASRNEQVRRAVIS